jgi:hypothetical protein
MGDRTAIPIAALGVVIAAGCGLVGRASPSAQPTPVSAASPAPPLTVMPTGTPAAPPFRTATAEVTAVATGFVRGVVEYDTTREGRLAFLARVRGLTAPTELTRLGRSSRARLPWRALRARAEQTTLEVNGVSLQPDTGDGLRVVVEAILTTHTTFATVTGFRRFTLSLVPAGSSWLVDRAEGLDR